MTGVNARCDECRKPFTPEDWDNRHSAANGEDIHEECCRQCNALPKSKDKK